MRPVIRTLTQARKNGSLNEDGVSEDVPNELKLKRME